MDVWETNNLSKSLSIGTNVGKDSGSSMFRCMQPRNPWFCDYVDVTLSLGVTEPRDELLCEGFMNIQEGFTNYIRLGPEE
jgi:hypothetical protein